MNGLGAMPRQMPLEDIRGEAQLVPTVPTPPTTIGAEVAAMVMITGVTNPAATKFECDGKYGEALALTTLRHNFPSFRL